MNNKLTPKALLFDMDGVLVDSLDSWWKSLNKALKQEKKQEISRDVFIKEYWGETLHYNLEKLGIDMSNSQFCNTIYQQYIDEVELFREAKETLKKLDKHPKAIITNTPKSCTIKILEKFKIKQFFDAIITSDEIEAGKPEPDMVLTACEQLAVNPKDVVLIGDTENDVKAGSAAGCITIGLKTKADFEIDSIVELLDIINNKRE